MHLCRFHELVCVADDSRIAATCEQPIYYEFTHIEIYTVLLVAWVPDTFPSFDSVFGYIPKSWRGNSQTSQFVIKTSKAGLYDSLQKDFESCMPIIHDYLSCMRCCRKHMVSFQHATFSSCRDSWSELLHYFSRNVLHMVHSLFSKSLFKGLVLCYGSSELLQFWSLPC